MKVKEIMSKTVYSLSPNVNLEYASAIMRDKNLGVMPVTHQGKLLGIVTDRDILLRGVAQHRDLKTTTVSDIMTKNVVKILPDQSVIEASKMMAKNKINATFGNMGISFTYNDKIQVLLSLLGELLEGK